MEINKSLVLGAPPEQVWALLLDPQAMLGCVPGMQSVEILNPDEYAALMQVKIAFVTAKFKLHTRIVERREPLFLKAEGTGEDASVASSLKQTTELTLASREDGGTDLQIKVVVDLLGRMGSFGLSVMKTKADRLWDEFGVNLTARLMSGSALEHSGNSSIATSHESATSLPSAKNSASPDEVSTTRTQRASVTPVAPRSWWSGVLRLLGIQHVGVQSDIIVIELRRPDQTYIRMEWPAAHAQECLRWVQEASR